jgi:hypothetical protein
VVRNNSRLSVRRDESRYQERAQVVGVGVVGGVVEGCGVGCRRGLQAPVRLVLMHHTNALTVSQLDAWQRGHACDPPNSMAFVSHHHLFVITRIH